ncbi:MAG: thermonuclease family protein, partial [Firmicutes bacterium]|nr:thermonuclease family protein [Bacillota bacterium]
FAGHWNFPGERQDKHIAMFPVELPSRLIKMFSFVGETVMDPFLGSGTTSLAAKKSHRNSVGFEINDDFIPITRNKLQSNQIDMFDQDEIIYQTRQNIDTDYSGDIARLPYQFKDPVQFDKKKDPRELQFGSRISCDKVEKKEYFKIKSILSPTTLSLENGQTIKLAGIREIQAKSEEAIEFLRTMTKGQKVHLEYDQITKIAENEDPYCYLYLKNKTFINAHLIKNGLADIDTSSEYSRKKQMLKYNRQKTA